MLRQHAISLLHQFHHYRICAFLTKVEAEALANYDDVEVEAVGLAGAQALEAAAHHKDVAVEAVAQLYEQRSIQPHHKLYVHLLLAAEAVLEHLEQHSTQQPHELYVHLLQTPN